MFRLAILTKDKHHTGWQSRFKPDYLLLKLNFENESCIVTQRGINDLRYPAATVNVVLQNKDVVIKPVKVEVEAKDLEYIELECQGMCEQELKAGAKRLFEEERGGRVP
jgi:virulence-associated protein VagC